VRIAAAVTMAYLVSLPLTKEPAPMLAPLTALLISQTTAHKSVVSGGRRVVSVIAGVLVASFLTSVLGLAWWSIGLTVFAALLLGALLRLGELSSEVAVSALLVLAVSGLRTFAVDRVWETLIGAGVGVAVNVLLAPPVYVQPAGDALVSLGRSMASLLRNAAGGLREEWSEASARRWLTEAWQLDRPLREAREALLEAEDSLKLNPHQRRARQADDSLRSGLSALEHAAITVRVLMTSLVDRVRGVPEGEMPAKELRLALADVLDGHAAAVRGFAELVGSDVTAPWQAEEELAGALSRSRQRPDALVEQLAVDAHTQPGLWQVNGSLLANLDRLSHELDPDTGTQAGAARRNSKDVEPWVTAMGRAARQRPDRDRKAGTRSSRGT
jgi:uncharacterized membrane protein YgaE (UPF0421/DUF939 family)